MKDEFTESNSGVQLQFSKDGLVELYDNNTDIEEIRVKYDPNPNEGYGAVPDEVKKIVCSSLLEKFFENDVCDYIRKNLSYDMVQKAYQQYRDDLRNGCY